MRRTQLVVSGLVLALAVGCGGSSKAPSAHTSKDSLSVLAAAQSKTAEAKSAKVAMTVVADAAGKTTNITGTGAFDFSKRLGTMSMTLPNPASGTDITMEMVYQGTVFYIGSDLFQQLAGKHWLKIDMATFTGDVSKLGGNDPSQGLEFLAGTKSAKVVGQETVRGASTTHYTATIDLDASSAKLGDTGKKLFAKYRELVGSATMPVDVWIDDAGRVARMTMSVTTKPSAATGGQAVTSTVTSEYYDWGTKVTAALPKDSEVADGNALLGRLTG